MELQKLEKMINTYLNDVQAFGEDNEYDNAKEVLIDFLLYFQSVDDEDFIDSIDEYYEKIDTDLGYDFDNDDED
jgi:Neuraminidase (sialidase)